MLPHQAMISSNAILYFILAYFMWFTSIYFMKSILPPSYKQWSLSMTSFSSLVLCDFMAMVYEGLTNTTFYFYIPLNGWLTITTNLFVITIMHAFYTFVYIPFDSFERYKKTGEVTSFMHKIIMLIEEGKKEFNL